MSRSRTRTISGLALGWLAVSLTIPASTATAHGPAPALSEGVASCSTGIARWTEFCEETRWCDGTEECLFTHGSEWVCVPPMADGEVLLQAPTISCCAEGRLPGDRCWTGDREGRCSTLPDGSSICIVLGSPNVFDYCGGPPEVCFGSAGLTTGAWGSFFAGDCDGDGLLNATDPDVCNPLDAGVPVPDAGAGADAGADVDAGANVDAGAVVDAGARIDAGPSTGRDSGGGTVPDAKEYSLRGGGGCACDAARPSPDRGIPLLAILLIGLLSLRRSRRR